MSTISYENKMLERANALFSIIKKAEAELEVMFGEAPRRGRPPKNGIITEEAHNPVETNNGQAS